jgi:hypothetical protein
MRLACGVLLSLALLQTARTAWADCFDCSLPSTEIQWLRSITQAAATAEEPLCLDEASRLFDAQFRGPSKTNATREIAGLWLVGRPDVLEAAARIFGPMPSRAAVERARGCADPICAVARAYGSEEAALRALAMVKRDGYALSISQHLIARHREDYKDATEFASAPETLFTPAEIRRIEKTIAALPAQMRRMPRLATFVRLPPGLSIYARWVSETDSPPRRYAVAFAQPTESDAQSGKIFHELAHHLQGIGMDSGQKWARFKALSGWVQDPRLLEGPFASDEDRERIVWSQGWTATRGDACFGSDYAKRNAWEDFAESAMLYLTGDPAFPAKCREKYEFMRGVVFPGYSPRPFDMSCGT